MNVRMYGREINPDKIIFSERVSISGFPEIDAEITT
jgi:hypothetical protein